MRRAVLNMRDERPIWAPPASAGARIREQLGAGWELVEVAAPVSGRGDGGGASDEAAAAMEGAEIYFGLGLPRELLRAGLRSGRLRWIHTGTAGVASLLHPELDGSGITLTNSAGIHAEPMAETVLGMMLYFARGFDHAVQAQPHDWNTTPFEHASGGVREIAGTTAGVIGFGGIGQAVARRCAALGMRVVAINRSGSAGEPLPEGCELLGSTAHLGELLRVSDFVVLTVPSTPETRGMIGARELTAMKPDSVLINVARGDVVDESALVDALSAQRLRGAGLDVFATEPLPPQSPLRALRNVLVTPHVSATSDRFWERQLQLILGNIARYRAGRPLRNVVDVQAGY